jgi:hypothetical protein
MHDAWHPHPNDPFKRPVFTNTHRPIQYPCQWSPGDTVLCRVMNENFTFTESKRFTSEQELQEYICNCLAEAAP